MQWTKVFDLYLKQNSDFVLFGRENLTYPVFEAMVSLPRSMFPLAALDVNSVLHLDAIP